MDIKDIVVHVDGSERAAERIQLATEIAALRDAMSRVFSPCQTPIRRHCWGADMFRSIFSNSSGGKPLKNRTQPKSCFRKLPRPVAFTANGVSRQARPATSCRVIRDTRISSSSAATAAPDFDAFFSAASPNASCASRHARSSSFGSFVWRFGWCRRGLSEHSLSLLSEHSLQ